LGDDRGLRHGQSAVQVYARDQVEQFEEHADRVDPHGADREPGDRGDDDRHDAGNEPAHLQARWLSAGRGGHLRHEAGIFAASARDGLEEERHPGAPLRGDVRR